MAHENNPKVRVRFAPSPTGYLHLGGLRTALFNFAFARANNGTFILRIEDTDQARLVPDAVETILESLSWVGIKPDEGPLYQSERLPIYRVHIDQLLTRGHAYHCFCSEERLEELRRAQAAARQPTRYDGHCRAFREEEVQQKIKEGTLYVVRQKLPQEGTTVFHDVIHGDICIANKELDDHILLKADGFPTYNFANVIDDHLMEITYVIRGEEFISSTPKHVQLYKAFGWQVPLFAHLPLLLNPDRSKLSKRSGDVAVEDYRKQGYLPEAMVNFVALLGWHPKDDEEIMTLEDILKKFDLRDCGKSGTVVDQNKLLFFNAHYLHKKKPEELFELALPYLLDAGHLERENVDKEYVIAALLTEQQRVKTVSELPEATAFFWKRPALTKELLVWKNSDPYVIKERLAAVKDYLESLPEKEYTAEKLESQIKAWINEKGWGAGEVLWPLRVALSGREKSPSPFEILAVLKKNESLYRIREACKLFEGH